MSLGIWKASMVSSRGEITGYYGAKDCAGPAYPTDRYNNAHSVELIPIKPQDELQFFGWTFDKVLEFTVNPFQGYSVYFTCEDKQGKEWCIDCEEFDDCTDIESIFNFMYLIGLCNSCKDAQTIAVNCRTKEVIHRNNNRAQIIKVSDYKLEEAEEVLDKLHEVRRILDGITPSDANSTSFLNRLNRRYEARYQKYIKRNA